MEFNKITAAEAAALIESIAFNARHAIAQTPIGHRSGDGDGAVVVPI